MEISILLHIFGGKMSEKRVAVVVRSQGGREGKSSKRAPKEEGAKNF